MALAEADQLVSNSLARTDLYYFARLMFLQRKGMKWQRARHHKIICDALMRVLRGECTRLIINVPPRYSKTELAVIMFSALGMGLAPDSEFIHISYSAGLTADNSQAIRDIVTSEGYQRIFPGVALNGDSTAKNHWKTTAEGVYFATSTGGACTGFGAGKHRDGFSGAIIIDDPHKVEEARSETIRKNVISWFQNTLETRQNAPGRTPIILIMQRLHQKDLAGWLLDGGNGETWEHICLPALDEETGEALWPEKHSVAALQAMRDAKPITYAGQMQQRPSAAAGNVFLPDMMPIIDAPPHGCRWVRGWDLAGTVDGDWTAGPKLGLMPDGRFVVAHVLRFRGLAHVVEATIKNTADRDGFTTKVSIPQDPGQAGKGQAAAFVKLLAGKNVVTSTESGDKVTRAEPLAAQMNVGNVLMVKGDWNDAFVEELRNFPNGEYDDQVDGASRAFNDLNMVPDRASGQTSMRG